MIKPTLEIDMVTDDSIAAFSVYEKVFGAKMKETTSYNRGFNEVICLINGTQFHILDENKDCFLVAPQKGVISPLWINLFVEDIRTVFEIAVLEGFTIIQPMMELNEYGVINAVIKDPFGHVWMLHQMVSEVSFEERCKLSEKRHGAAAGTRKKNLI